jgi:hypothetical protein
MYRRFRHQRKLPALQTRKMLSNHIHFLNGSATSKQLLSDPAKVVHRKAFGRKGKQTGPAARDQNNKLILGTELSHFLGKSLRGLLAGVIGHGVASLHTLKTI